MKGMKKLFALLAVLTMALTLTPMVAPVAAADELKATVVQKGTSNEYVVLDFAKSKTATIEVSKLTLNGVSISLDENVSYTWFSGNSRLVTVSGTGTSAVITAHGYGKANIFVKVEYTPAEGVSYTGQGSIPVYVTGLEVKDMPSNLTLYTEQPGNATEIKPVLVAHRLTSAPTDPNADVETATLTTDPIQYNVEVDPEDIVSVIPSGEQEAAAQGITIALTSNVLSATDGIITFTATYKATYNDDSFDYTGSYRFPVTIKEHEVMLSANIPPTMLKGTSVTSTAAVLLDGKESAELTDVSYDWVPSDPSIVSVEIDGTDTSSATLKANAAGSATITVSATYTFNSEVKTVSKAYPITVEEPTLTVNIEGAPEITIGAGTSTVLIANVTINTGDTITYSWTNSNPNAVIVDSIDNNKILIRGANVTQEDYSIITVTAKAGSLTKTATIKVIVTPAAAPSLSVSITGTTQLVVDATALYNASVTAQNIPGFDANMVTYVWESNNPNVAAVVSGITSKDAVVKGISAGYATLKVTAKYGQYTAEAYLPIEVVTATVPPLTNVILANANGQWVTVGSDRLYQVSYDVYNAPTNAQGLVVQLRYGDTVLGESALNFRQVSARFESIWTALGGKDGVLKLVLLNSTASTTVPVSFLKLDSTFKDSYISGEHSGAVTGTITAQKSGFVIGSSNSTMELGLVAQWEDAEGNVHALKLKTVTATVGPDGKFAEFALPANLRDDVHFNVPAGNVYVVSKNVYDGMADGKYNGIPVAKFAYKTIAIKQGTLTANPNTIVLGVNQDGISGRFWNNSYTDYEPS